MANKLVDYLINKRDLNNNDQEESLEEGEILQGAYLTSQPRSLKGGQLQSHQMEGLNWLISLNELGISGILADEMGLGKTIQAISLLAYLMESQSIRGPYLIVCPNSVMGNWVKELSKWLPQLRTIKLIAR